MTPCVHCGEERPREYLGLCDPCLDNVEGALKRRCIALEDIARARWLKERGR